MDAGAIAVSRAGKRNSTSPMSSSVEHTGMAAPSRPMNMGDDRNQFFLYRSG
jgi:hypothetical protein